MFCFNPYSIGSYFGRLLFLFANASVPSWFQSLFYWKLLWKFRKNSVLIPCSKVSILILLEVTLEAHARKQAKACESLFQSLFYWKLLWKNPNIFRYVWFSSTFQSLFYWKLLWKHKTTIPWLYHWTVSILILLEVTLEESTYLATSWIGNRFNPYSIGSYFGSMGICQLP